MKLYGGIDLHSTNQIVALLDEQDQLVYQKRLVNTLGIIVKELSPLSSHHIKHLTVTEVDELLPNPQWALAVKSSLWWS